MSPGRFFIPGRWNRNGRAIPDAQASELDNVVPLLGVPITVTGGAIPLRRRIRRAWREFVAFISAPRFWP
jgi:hypothetical protein